MLDAFNFKQYKHLCLGIWEEALTGKDGFTPKAQPSEKISDFASDFDRGCSIHVRKPDAIHYKGTNHPVHLVGTCWDHGRSPSVLSFGWGPGSVATTRLRPGKPKAMSRAIRILRPMPNALFVRFVNYQGTHAGQRLTFPSLQPPQKSLASSIQSGPPHSHRGSRKIHQR